MSVEVRAQNTISMTSVKAIKDATDQSAQLLAEMEEYAEDAGTTLTGIYQVAKDAETSASNAQTSANNAQASAETALTNLSQVQSVLDVVNWVALHGEYEKTTDVAINPNKTYYTVTATAVATPTDDDIGTYYELVSGEYVKTTDTTVVTGKTYYYVVGTPVTDPDVSDIGTYYELFINEAMTNYIMSHLALTNDGLYVMADNSEWKVLIKSNGVDIINSTGTVVASYGANIVLGRADSENVRIDSDSLDIRDGTSILASYSADKTTIGKIGLGKVWAEVTEQGFEVKRLPNYSTQTRIPIGGIIYDNGLVKDPFGASFENSWSHTLDFTPKTGTTILVRHTSGVNYVFTAGTAGYDARVYYDGDKTISFTKSIVHIQGGVKGITYYATDLAGGYVYIGNHSISDQLEWHGKDTALFGRQLIAKSDYQTAIGKFNDNDDTNAFEIGNGTDANNRSNALTVDWSGNVVASGDITDGYGNTLSNVSVNSTDVPTADTIAEFDSTAHMNSTDMTSQEVSDFVDGLDVGGGGTAVDLVIEQGTDTVTFNGATFIWTYRKWLSGFAEAWTYKEGTTNSGGDWQTSAYCPKLFEYTSQVSVQATGWASGNANGGVRHAHPMQNGAYGGWLIDTWLRNGNANTLCGISWYITGRWE